MALLLGVPAMVFSVLEAVVPTATGRASASALLHAPFYFFVSYAMIRYLFHDDRVTRDELYATGAAFTVVAWGFAYLYAAAQVPGRARSSGAGGAGERTWFELLFLSFTTLTSVGLSDVVPVLPHARSLVMIEQVAGVLYVALVVARLVGLHRRSGSPGRHRRDVPVSVSVVPAVGTVLLRQLRDDEPVGLVDRLEQLVVGDRAAEGEVVPAGPADVGHHRRVVREAVEPLVGHLAGGTALDPDAVAAEEREDLAALPRRRP